VAVLAEDDEDEEDDEDDEEDEDDDEVGFGWLLLDLRNFVFRNSWLIAMLIKGDLDFSLIIDGCMRLHFSRLFFTLFFNFLLGNISPWHLLIKLLLACPLLELSSWSSLHLDDFLFYLLVPSTQPCWLLTIIPVRCLRNDRPTTGKHKSLVQKENQGLIWFSTGTALLQFQDLWLQWCLPFTFEFRGTVQA
jgi:hypothetical protein